MIREAGFNGTAATTWGAEFPKKIGGKSVAGRPYGAMWSKYAATAILETTIVGVDSVKP